MRSTAWGCREHPYTAGAQCPGRGTGPGWLWSISGSEEQENWYGCPQGAACMDGSAEAPAVRISVSKVLGRQEGGCRLEGGFREARGCSREGVSWALGSCDV